MVSSCWIGQMKWFAFTPGGYIYSLVMLKKYRTIIIKEMKAIDNKNPDFKRDLRFSNFDNSVFEDSPDSLPDIGYKNGNSMPLLAM